MALIDDYKNLVFKKEIPDSSMLVPLLIWVSGERYNIEVCQDVNRRFFHIPKDLNMRSLYLNNKVKKFIKFPKASKSDTDIDFFYTDLATMLGWTKNELRKNISCLNLEELKEEVALKFAYENKERKSLGLKIR